MVPVSTSGRTPIRAVALSPPPSCRSALFTSPRRSTATHPIPVAVPTTHRALATELTTTADGDGHQDGQDHGRSNAANDRPLRSQLGHQNGLVLATGLVRAPGVRAVDVAIVHVLLVDAELFRALK